MYPYTYLFAVTLISFLIWADDGDEPSDDRIYLKGVVTKDMSEKNGVKNSYTLTMFFAVDNFFSRFENTRFKLQKERFFIILSSSKNENIDHSIIDCFEPEEGMIIYEGIITGRRDNEETKKWKQTHRHLNFYFYTTDSYRKKVFQERRIYGEFDVKNIKVKFNFKNAEWTKDRTFDISNSSYEFDINPLCLIEKSTEKDVEKIDKDAFDTALGKLAKFKQEFLDTIEGKNKKKENQDELQVDKVNVENDATGSTDDSLIPIKPLGETQKDVENRSLFKNVGFILVLVFFVVAAIIFLLICLKTKAKKYVVRRSRK